MISKRDGSMSSRYKIIRCDSDSYWSIYSNGQWIVEYVVDEPINKIKSKSRKRKGL